MSVVPILDNAPIPMRERAGLLRNYWYAAAQSSQVNSKKPLGRIVLGEMLVLWRTRAGRVVVMKDRCLHRNALLSRGDLFDDCIGCPYHGWTYDVSGTCVNVPSEGPQGKANPQQKLTTFAAKEQDGLIWVWMGYGQPDKEPFAMPYWRAPGWGSYYMENTFENGVTNLVENFMDVPHTVFVHKGWFRNRQSKRVRATVERTDSSVLVTYQQPKDSIGFTGRILNPRGLPMVHTDKFYMPNNTRVDYVFGNHASAFVITSTCTPVSDYQSQVYTLISYKLGMFNALAKLLLPRYTQKVIDQDVEIMAIQSEGLKHYGNHAFAHTPADTLHVSIEALREWDESGGVGNKPQPLLEEMEFWI